MDEAPRPVTGLKSQRAQRVSLVLWVILMWCRQLRVSWRTTLGEPGMLLSPRITCNADTSATLRPVEVSTLATPRAPPF